VHGKDLLVNDCSNRQAVEAVGECLPEFDIVTPFACNMVQSVNGAITIANRLTLIVETVYPVDTGAFVVPSQNEEVFWVFDLVGEE
jgi:hypothetical protein